MAMNCAYHPDRDAMGACVSCGRLVCIECKTELGGKIYCNPCADKQFSSGHAQEQLKTGLEVKTGFFPLAWALNFCQPVIVVDGTAYRTKWGLSFFELAPGRHTVKIFFRYLSIPECGANSIDVLVEQGKVSRIRYSGPQWIFSKGSIKTGQPYLTGQVPTGYMAKQVGSYTEESEGLSTKKPAIGGILSIIAGVTEVIMGTTGSGGWFVALLGVVAIIGGVYAIKRRLWGFALAGAICSLVAFFLGIPAIILIALSKAEFK
ncbi:hypothetical protein ACFLU4_03380 [Chloroflexota bacterium]